MRRAESGMSPLELAHGRHQLRVDEGWSEVGWSRFGTCDSSRSTTPSSCCHGESLVVDSCLLGKVSHMEVGQVGVAGNLFDGPL